jgi:hypothetical protein
MYYMPLLKETNTSFLKLQKIAKWRSIVRGLELGMANCVISLIYSLTCKPMMEPLLDDRVNHIDV